MCKQRTLLPLPHTQGSKKSTGSWANLFNLVGLPLACSFAAVDWFWLRIWPLGRCTCGPVSIPGLLASPEVWLQGSIFRLRETSVDRRRECLWVWCWSMRHKVGNEAYHQGPPHSQWIAEVSIAVPCVPLRRQEGVFTSCLVSVCLASLP